MAADGWELQNIESISEKRGGWLRKSETLLVNVAILRRELRVRRATPPGAATSNRSPALLLTHPLPPARPQLVDQPRVRREPRIENAIEGVRGGFRSEDRAEHNSDVAYLRSVPGPA